MYLNNLKQLRNNFELTQADIAKKLNVTRNVYKNWENGYIMIPLKSADKLSLFYNVRLSYILGLDQELVASSKKIRRMNYNTLLKNLSNLKKVNNNSYDEIAIALNCVKSTCHGYFTGKRKIPIDRLIELSKLYEVDLDKLCGKE